jgi:hypothetical protein
MTTPLTTAGEVIDALGGTSAVAEIFDVWPSAVSNWRKLGFPAWTHSRITRVCGERGIEIAVELTTAPNPRAARSGAAA